MARICVDACFLIGLYDRDDQYHDAAMRQFEALFGPESARHQLVAPWPVLYECLDTRCTKDPRKSALLSRIWNGLSDSGQLVLIDDGPFRETPLRELLEETSRALSLVDRVLRAMILSRERLFDYFLTYNTGDFSDACQRGSLPLINEESAPESYGF
jgi:predicted nucleic acid-binding protein